VREVSDSLHLRRFCRIPIDQRVPDESTVRKLVRRLGEQPVSDTTRALISKAQHERRFYGGAVRIDSTVVEADVRYPTGSGLALAAATQLVRVTRAARPRRRSAGA
jgi:transposase, IS5 family